MNQTLNISQLLKINICMFLIGGSLTCRGDDWNLWRGPNCDGRVEAPGYFPEQPFGLEIIWNQAVGSAYSSISIVDGHVLTMFNDGKSDFVGRLELTTGKEIWRYRIGRIYEAHDGGHDGPVSTPVGDKQHVYALGPRGRLFALDATTGTEIWSVQIEEQYDAKVPFWGFATTPIVWQEFLIVQASGRGRSGIIAFDKTTGAFVWHYPLGRTDYRSPVLINVDGKHQIIACDDLQTVGLDPANGHRLWSYSQGIENSKTPLYLGNRKLLLTRQGSELIQFDEEKGTANQIWRSREFGNSYAVASFHNGFLYGFSGRYLTCVDAESGDRRWRSRRPGGKGLIIVDGHLIVLGDHGDVVIAEATSAGYTENSGCILGFDPDCRGQRG